MGSELVSYSQPRNGGGDSRSPAPKTYTEIFNEYFPYYLSIGMTYEQYWYGDCRLTEYYRKAQKIRDNRRNQELWLQGAYIYEALLDVAPVLQAFAKKGAKPRMYAKEPYALTVEDVRAKRKSEEEKQYEKNKSIVEAWMAATNAKIKKQQEVATDG